MSVLVSVCCITYNHENYIAEALESFLMQQTNFEFEILVGEDCSTDNTRQTVLEYQKRYPDKIRMITSEKNVGASQNSHRVRQNSKGKYIALCEGDDYWTNSCKLQKQVDYMEAHSDCTICFHAAEVVKADGKKTGELLRPHIGDAEFTVEDIIFRLGGDFFATGSAMYPKFIMDDPPQWFLDAPVGDVPLKLLCTHHGYLGYLDEVMSARRRGVPGSWCFRFEKDKKNQIYHCYKMTQMFNSFDNYTEGRYSSLIKKIIIATERNLILSQRDRQCLKDVKYKKMLAHWSLKEQGLLYLELYFPNVLSCLGRIKIFLVNIIKK